MYISQQQFEAMAIKRGLSVEKKKDIWGQEKYKYDMIQIMWEGWQASRGAMKPVAFTIRDDSGYLYLNRMTMQEGDELNHQLNLLQKYCPEKQYSITPLYRLDK